MSVVRIESDGPLTVMSIDSLHGGGARTADAVVLGICGLLCETEDLRGAVKSFLAEGPGHATHAGR